MYVLSRQQTVLPNNTPVMIVEFGHKFLESPVFLYFSPHSLRYVASPIFFALYLITIIFVEK
jgi:hypothetical protein